MTYFWGRSTYSLKISNYLQLCRIHRIQEMLLKYSLNSKALLHKSNLIDPVININKTRQWMSSVLTFSVIRYKSFGLISDLVELKNDKHCLKRRKKKDSQCKEIIKSSSFIDLVSFPIDLILVRGLLSSTRLNDWHEVLTKWITQWRLCGPWFCHWN